MSEHWSTEPEREGGPGDARDYTAARRGGVRRNALSAGTFVAIAEVDPRVADALLGSLEDAGVAAYAEPVAGVRGVYLDTHAPRRPTDRVYVDAARRDTAEAVLAAELPGLMRELEPVDPDSAFAAIVAAWDTEVEAPVPPWPVDEDVPADPARPAPERAPVRPEPEAEGNDEAAAPAYDDEGHYEPPVPAPLPEVSPVTRWAAIAVAGGLLVLLVLPFTGTEPSPLAQYLAILAIVGGIGTLVWRMRDAPSVDDGPDDGAVV